jgi:hypothetical protein
MSAEGDIVLIYHKDQPSVYGRIEAIRPDIKKDWYQVTLTLLTIPHQVVTWILRAEYINGAPFTMGGNTMKMVQFERLSIEDIDRGKNSSDVSDTKQKSSIKIKIIPFKKGDESDRE